MKTEATHEQLFDLVKYLPTDFKPYGNRKRGNTGDCSCTCKWYHELEGMRGSDWGICFNPESPRKGLLTFEHQGCPEYEYNKHSDIDDQFTKLLYCKKCGEVTRQSTILLEAMCTCGTENKLEYDRKNYYFVEKRKKQTKK